MSKRHFHAMFTIALIKVAKREKSTSVSINGVTYKENLRIHRHSHSRILFHHKRPKSSYLNSYNLEDNTLSDIRQTHILIGMWKL